MKTSRARVVRRLGVIVAAAVVAGSYFTGFAFAADDPSGSDSGSGSGSSLVKPLQEVVPNAELPDLDPGDITDTLSSVVSTLTSVIPTGLPTGSSTATGPSGSNTVIQYSPYPYPVFGDYGHRYYGKYYDNGCGCDRYAAPTYVPQTVVATQVASVPKGGVDTGDGSFQ